MKKHPTVLIWKNKCWESRGSNLGDLAIISATIAALKREIADIEITMFSDDPKYTAALYGIRAIRINVKNIIRTMREIDLLLLGGGTVFTDASSWTTIPINTSLLYLARILKKPIAAYSIASGKMSWLGWFLVRGVLHAFSFVTVRDEDSRRDLQTIYPDIDTRIWVTEDAAFSLQCERDATAHQNRVVIAPRRIFHYTNSFLPFYMRKRLQLLPTGYYKKMEAFTNVLAELADYVVEKYGADITFLPMYSGMGHRDGVSGYLKSRFSSRDDLMCSNILSRMHHRERANIFLSDKPREVIHLLGNSRMLIGVPLHSLILAHLSNTPFVGLSYQGKVSRFMRRTGMEDFMIHVESIESPLDKEEFREKVDRCMESEEKLRETIGKLNAEIRDIVNKPAVLVKEMFTTVKKC